MRQTLVNFLSEDAIAIMDDEAVGMIVRQRFPELLQCPFRRGIGCDDVVETPAASDLHDDQDVQGAEGGGDHREEVAGHHDPGVVTDNGQPALFPVRRANWTVSMEVLADGARGDLNGQLELQLVGDAFLSPGRILCGYLADESAQILGDLVYANGPASARRDGIPCGASGGRYRAGRSPGRHAK